ncbi:unnamed protein product, partial [Mesorhabditis spiculigera]
MGEPDQVATFRTVQQAPTDSTSEPSLPCHLPADVSDAQEVQKPAFHKFPSLDMNNGMGGGPPPMRTGPPQQSVNNQQPGANDPIVKVIRFFQTILRKEGGDQLKSELVRLVQEVITERMEPTAFTEQLQAALGTKAQPHLVSFLGTVLPTLREAIKNGDVKVSVSQDGLSMLFDAPRIPPSLLQTAVQRQPPPMQQTGQQPSPQLPRPQQNMMPPQQQQHMQSHLAHQQGPLHINQPMHAPPNGKHEPMDVGHQPHMQNEPHHQPSHERQQPTPSQQQSQQQQQQPPPQQQSQQPINNTLSEEEVVRTYKEGPFAHAMIRAEQIMAKITQRMNTACYVDEELLTMISDAAENRVRELVAELAVTAQHRIDPNPRLNPDYTPIDDTKNQLKWLETMDKQLEDQRLLRERDETSKGNKGKTKDTLEKAKDMQRAEAEEKRAREANAAAIAALGGSKPRPNRWDTAGAGSAAHANLRPKVIRVNLRDFQTVYAANPRNRRSQILHKLALATPPADSI